MMAACRDAEAAANVYDGATTFCFPSSVTRPWRAIDDTRIIHRRHTRLDDHRASPRTTRRSSVPA